MSVYVGGLVIKGIAFEIHGERYMHPELDCHGQRLHNGYDYYDVYTMGTKLGCLDCINEGHPFYKLPTVEELKKYLDGKDFFSTFNP